MSSNRSRLKEWDVLIEAEVAANGLIFGHGDTKGRVVSGPPTLVVEYPPRWCQLSRMGWFRR